ncbi:MAG: UvrB/UvrC motif-containing protein [Oscillospiraceae bacterium]|nr:UvrB/UvrC motif-containing protein [Oscillospiraceae bacterium]
MRCEHCGRNEATFHYQSAVNGYTEEAHLCRECAERLGYDTGAGLSETFAGAFDDTFGSVFSFLPSLFGGIDDFFTEPRLTAPARRTLRLSPEPDQPYYETESLLNEAEGQALRREREHNSLEVRLREAVEAENYEEAALLRDELKRLDNQ